MSSGEEEYEVGELRDYEKKRFVVYKFNSEAIFEAKVEKPKARSRNPKLLWVSN
jgi:hypothetical protein